MFKLKRVDPAVEKRKEKIDKLIKNGEKFKERSLKRWNNKISKYDKK